MIESFLYGVYPGLVFVPIYNFLTRMGELEQSINIQEGRNLTIGGQQETARLTR